MPDAMLTPMHAKIQIISPVSQDRSVGKLIEIARCSLGIGWELIVIQTRVNWL